MRPHAGAGGAGGTSTALGPHPGRGKVPETVTGTGDDELAAMTDGPALRGNPRESARSDLDLQNMTLTIRHQISGSGRTAILVETKTASSVATIPLPPFVVDRLRAHLEDQRP